MSATLEPEAIRRLVFNHYLPEPYTVDGVSGEPLWRFRELAELFGVSESDLAEVVMEQGQRFMRVNVGTSAGLLVRP